MRSLTKGGVVEHWTGKGPGLRMRSRKGRGYDLLSAA
jgi:hypothetical protein